MTKSAREKLTYSGEFPQHVTNYVEAEEWPAGHEIHNRFCGENGEICQACKNAVQERRGLRAAARKMCPVGTVKLNGDGYLVRKIDNKPNNGTGATSKNWEFVHRRVWEDAHGPIPKGYRLWWKDGDHNNCALENLELLSGKEHMARTTVHTLPPVLKQVIHLRDHLFETLEALRDELKPMDIERAKAVAKVEVAYARATDAMISTEFFDEPPKRPALPPAPANGKANGRHV